MATVIYGDSSSRQVTNLGWLLRHNSNVSHFVVLPTRDDAIGVDCVLVVAMENLTSRGKEVTTFVSSFADRRVLKDFLDRPVFRGLQVVWFGETETIGSRHYRELIVSRNLRYPVTI